MLKQAVFNQTSGQQIAPSLVSSAIQDARPSWSCRDDPRRKMVIIQCKFIGQKPSEYLNGHLGVHPGYFVPFVEQSHHLQVIMETIDGLKKAFQEGKCHVLIVFLDYHGQHGSAAACKAISTCVKQDSQLSLTKVHFTAPASDGMKIVATEDSFYAEETNEGMRDALRTVVADWNQTKKSILGQ